MEPLEPLDQMLRGPAAVGPAERMRRLATPPRLAGAAVVAAVLGALVVIAASSPSPVEMSLPQASASDGERPPSGAGVGDTADAASVSIEEAVAPTTSMGPDVVVHVAGSVATPGLVELPAAARVADALAAAGGPVAGADVDRLNLAAPVVDGGRVYVPLVGQAEPVVAGPAPAPSPGATTSELPATGPIDLNSATVAELDVLPGVGPTTASAIVAHREENGPFLGVDELQDVRGIGPAKFEALRDLVVAGG